MKWKLTPRRKAAPHEAKEEPVEFLAGLEQALLKRSERFLVTKNLGAIVAAIQDVIARTGKFESEFSRRVGTAGVGEDSCNIKR